MKRHAKALQRKAKKCIVTPIGGADFRVVSPSGKKYIVTDTTNGIICTCDWGQYHDTRYCPCSHVIAAENWIAEGGGRRLSVWTTYEDAKRQHRHIERIGYNTYVTARKI